MPDVATVCEFRHRLAEHHLNGEILQAVNLNLQGHGVKIMHQTKKIKQLYFGMKAHVGVDRKTKLIHSVEARAVVGLKAIARVTCKAQPFGRSGIRFLGDSRRSCWDRAYRPLGDYPRFKMKADVAQTGEWYRLRCWI